MPFNPGGIISSGSNGTTGGDSGASPVLLAGLGQLPLHAMFPSD